MDEGLIATARARLYAGVISDVLDSLGDMDHALAPGIRPLDEGLTLFGRARTGLYASVYHVEPGTNPYQLEIELIDSLAPDDVPVLACPPGNRVAPWGELLSTAAEQEVQQFKESEVQIAGSFGFDIDITKNLYLTTLVRINYSFTDMRNEELLEILEDGGAGAFDIFGRRANVLVGLQFGVHFMIGGVPSWGGF